MMRRWYSLVGACVLLFSAVALAQEHGHLVVTVQTRPDAPAPAGRAVGAKVIVVHWAHSQLHPTMIQDQVATTNQMGRCTIDLPPGSYDVFVTASGLSPVAVKRDVQAGQTTPLVVTLKSAPSQLRPVDQ